MSSHLDDNIIPPSRQREAPRKDLKWIGKSMKRVEDPRLLTGKGKYIDDLSVANMTEAAVLRSRTLPATEWRAAPGPSQSSQPTPCRDADVSGFRTVVGA